MEILTPKQASEAGLSKSGLYRAIQAGRYERITHGLYRPADAPPADWDWIEAASRRPDATICLTSALAHHDLIDTIPRSLDIAIPRGAWPPTGSGSITWHHFDAATFNLGRTEITIPGSALDIGLYSPERCIVDAFRLRSAVGYEAGRDALREWLHRGGKPTRLMEMATQLPRAKAPLLRMLEALT
jgi:predicted transcriptional regulator of viral defense system